MARRSILLLTLVFVGASAGACGDDGGSAAEQFSPPDEQETSADEGEAEDAADTTEDTVPTPTLPVAGPAVAAYCEGVADFASSVDALVGDAVPNEPEVVRLLAQADELTSSLFEEAAAEAGGSIELGDCVNELDAAYAAFSDFATP